MSRNVAIEDRRVVPAKGRVSTPPEPLFTQVMQGEGVERSLRLMKAEWDELHGLCPSAGACGLHAWVTAWWDAFGEGPYGRARRAKLVLVLMRGADGVLVAAFPLFEEAAGPLGLRPRVLREVGRLGRVGVHDMTEGLTAIVMRGWEREAAKALASVLRKGLEAGRWDRAVVRVPDAEVPGGVEKELESLSEVGLVRFKRHAGSRVAELPATWADYRKRLTKSMRDNLGYYSRLLTRDGHDWAVRVATEPKEVREAAGRLAALHRARYGQLRGPSHTDHIHSPTHRVFLTTVLTRLAHEGRASVAELVVGGAVVASQAFVESGDRLTVYYSGSLEAWHRYSPVFVIDAAVFEAAHDRGVRRVDFMDAQKAWVERWGARCENPSLVATLSSRRPAARARLALDAARTAWAREVRERAIRLARRLDRGFRRLGRA